MTQQALANRLPYRFVNVSLLTQALTHRSFSAQNNERLEFLGDGALNFIIAQQLFRRFQALAEGDLSRLRAQLVKEATLCEIAQSLDVGAALKLGEGELKSGGWRRPSILADALEALVGAVYLDGGYDEAEALVIALFADKLATIDPNVIDKDPKSLLQEHLQGQKLSVPEYKVTQLAGEAHVQLFMVECYIEKLNIRTAGEGTSRRIAEQQAANYALIALEKIALEKIK
ncbi:MAG: ribonuclease III [Methylophilales bacterium]|nr:ribonuclease III [Methylophilales bacterium]